MSHNSAEFNRSTHVFASAGSTPAPRVVPIAEKEVHAVFRSGEYIFLRLPADEEFVRREGWDMRHCLAVAHSDYCRRMRAGEIEVYSMTHVPTNMPVVDIEVALTRSSYGGPVDGPTVSQIRGVANQCPPDDSFLPHLMEFFRTVGSRWEIEGHSVGNFDGKCDGDVVTGRWAQLCERPGSPAA